jgi:tape measure domain-containing protein
MPTADEVSIVLDADVTTYVRNLVRGEQEFNKRMNSIERSSLRASSTIKTSLGGAVSAVNRSIGTLAAGYLGAQGIRQVIAYADSYTAIQNALKSTGLSGQSLTDVYDQLKTTALANNAPLASLVTLYSRVSQSQKSLGVTGQDVLDLTETVSKALRVQGGSAEAASGALLQLSQAFSGGTIQAEEYNSLIDGLTPLLRAAAAGIKEAQGDVGKLTQLVKSGQVSSRTFFLGIQAGSSVLDKQLGGAVTTVEGALQNLQTVLTDTIGRVNDGSGATKNLVDAINSVADVIANADFGPMVEGLSRVISEAVSVIDWLDKLEGRINSLPNAKGNDPIARLASYVNNPNEIILKEDDKGQQIAGVKSEIDQLKTARDQLLSSPISVKLNEAAISAAEQRIARLQAQLNALEGGGGTTPAGHGRTSTLDIGGGPPVGHGRTSTAPIADAPVSIADNPTAKKTTGKSAAEKQAESIARVTEELKFQNEQLDRGEREQAVYEALEQASVKSTDASAASIRAQAEALYDRQKIAKADETVQSLIEEQAQLARTDREQAVYNAYKQASITGADDAAAAVRQHAEALYDLEQAQKAVNDAQKAGADLLSDSLSDLIVEGKTLQQVAYSALKAIANMLIQAGVAGTGPLAGIFGTQATGGGAGGLVGSLVGAFGRKAGGGQTQGVQIVGEKGPELLAMGPNSGTIIPNDRLGMPRSGSSGPGKLQVTVVNPTGDDNIRRMAYEGAKAVVDQYDRTRARQTSVASVAKYQRNNPR